MTLHPPIGAIINTMKTSSISTLFLSKYSLNHSLVDPIPVNPIPVSRSQVSKYFHTVSLIMYLMIKQRQMIRNNDIINK